MDPGRLLWYRNHAEVDPSEWFSKKLFSRATWERAIGAKPVRIDSAYRLRALVQAPDVFAIMHPSELARFAGVFAKDNGGQCLPDWDLNEPQSGGITVPNGLKYFVWKLKHRAEDGRFARGKRYDLSPMATSEQDRLRHFLTRHGKVCNLLRGNPLFPEHLTTTPDTEGRSWWVLDEWIEGRTLEDALYRNSLNQEHVPPVLREIAEALKALHTAKIIRRDLSPWFVILRKESDSVVLTDFELAKLLEGEPTVRGTQEGNPYRAPQVGDEPLTERDLHVDMYSWGRIAVHVTTGGLPARGREAAAVAAAELPAAVSKIICRCVSLDVRQRPGTMDEVLKAIRSWK